MQEGPRFEKFPIAIQFLATYVIVMGVSNHSESIKMAMKLAYGSVDHGCGHGQRLLMLPYRNDAKIE